MRLPERLSGVDCSIASQTLTTVRDSGGHHGDAGAMAMVSCLVAGHSAAGASVAG